MSARPAAPPDHGGASILVVDDRRANLVAMEALLSPLGRPVALAQSGEDALRRVLAEDFAVILLDVQMPGMDGFETAHFIRERQRSRHVPIIFVTAISTEAERVFDGYRAGAVDYILKPVNPDVLRAKVRVFLDLHEANARLRRQESMRAAHESLALAQRAGMSGVWDWDIAAGRMFCSPEYEELCGLAPARSADPGAWLDVVHPAERGHLSRRLEGLLEGGDEWDEEYRIVHAERGIRWIAARGRVYRGAGGDAQRFTGIAFDVTERKQAEARAGRLHEATAALSAAASAEEVAKLVLLHAPAAAGARAASLWLAGDDEPPPAMPAEAVGAAREALRDGPPVVAVGGGRITLLTLSAGGGPSGVLCLDYGRRPPPDSEARAFLAGLGAHCAQALERARLFDAERRARERARFSADVSLTLDAAGLGVQSRLDRLADLLVPRLADVCLIALEGEDGELETVATRAAGRDAEHAPSGHEAAEQVLDSGEPRLAADGGALVVPISAHGRVLGTLTLVAVGPVRRFDDDDLRMATDIGRRTGLAVQNARLFEEQATVALTLQKSLLPRELPDVDGISWAARYLPKAAGTEAGGDWFVAVPAGDGRVMVAVGDVVGRGTGAAAVMGQLRSAARAYATAGMTPGAILGHLSRLAESIPGAFASTAACVEIDPAGERLRYARAGHPPPLLVAPDGRAELLPEVHGTVLGIRHDEREEVEAPMASGAALVLYTDGAVERRGEQLDAGLDRLARTAAACWPAAPATLCDDLVARLFTAEGPADDVALLVVRTGLPGPLALRAPARLDELSGMRAGVREWLRTVPLAHAEREDVLLACGEALANAVEHGAGRAGGMMWVDGSWSGEGVLRVRVRDDGRWREPEPDPLGLRGRGISLMRRIMDEVEVHSADGHTEVAMSLRPQTPSSVLVGTAAGTQAAASRPAQPAEVEVIALEGMRMVRLRGEIDSAAAPALRAELEALLLVPGPVTVDAGDADYLDSAGVALLWDFGATLAGQGREMHLIAPEGSRVRRVLELTRPRSVEILDALAAETP